MPMSSRESMANTSLPHQYINRLAYDHDLLVPYILLTLLVALHTAACFARLRQNPSRLKRQHTGSPTAPVHPNIDG
ncbi:hypothetical protein D3C78_822660 [compost metagenome]